MSGGKNPTIDRIFESLNVWRHLPSYSLETRAAPFFAVFLRDVLSAHFKTEIHDVLIPEFPLRIGTLNDEKISEQKVSAGRRRPSPDQSYNVDYVAFAKDKSTAYLVELKTDMDSLREKQKTYLRAAQGKGLPRLIEGIRQLATKSRKKQKYVHLLHCLSAPGLELVSNFDDTPLLKKTFGRVTPGWTSAIEQLEFDKESFSNSKVVFIQPIEHIADEHDFEYIYFKTVASIVKSQGKLGEIFARYLCEWTSVAGSQSPRNITPPW